MPQRQRETGKVHAKEGNTHKQLAGMHGILIRYSDIWVCKTRNSNYTQSHSTKWVSLLWFGVSRKMADKSKMKKDMILVYQHSKGK